MREYSFEATGETIGALRHLQRPWRAVGESADGLVVHCGTGAVVRIEAVAAELEPGFSATCLMATLEPDAVPPAAPAPGAFATGLNDVVLFNSESWLATGAPGHGPPGGRPDSADAACIVTDALLLDSGGGPRLLVRAAPGAPDLVLVRDDAEIRAFTGARGYDE